MFLLQTRRSLLLAPALLLAAHLPAQNATPTITANARLVVLDTVVTDKAGNPVDNLTASDFQVFEDNVPQRIRSVEPPSVHVLPATSPSSTTTVFDPAQPSPFGQSPVTVLVLDQLNTHFADSSYARRSLHDYLTRQPALLAQPTTLLTVFDLHFKQLQPFTRSRDALLAALAAAPTQYAWKLEVNGKTDLGPAERLEQSLNALTEMAQSYARIPGRKNLIWVGAGFPSLDPNALDTASLKQVQDAIHHVTNLMLDVRITLYAVDPTTTAAGMTEITDGTQMAFVMGGGDSVGRSLDPFDSEEGFDRLGPLTGGRVIRAMNDVDQQIATSVDLGSHFYTIAYTPGSTSEASAKFRRIRVVCLRPGLTVTTRDGYYPTATVTPQSILADATSDLSSAAETSVPLNGLRVTVTPAKAGSWIIHVSASSLVWKPQPDGAATASVYVMVVSLNAKGKMIAHTVHGMTATAKAGANLSDPAQNADFALSTSAAAKATTLRFVVRDSATGRMGSVDLPATH